jgi:hypothetical protein
MRLAAISVAMLMLAGLAPGQGADGLEPGRSGAVQAVGAVRGQVVKDHQRPAEPPIPRPDASIVLVPWDEDLVRDLEELRRRSRQDMRTYVRSALAIEEAIRAHRARLDARGVGETVHLTHSGPDGRFRLEAVPAGRWLLVARVDEVVTTSGKSTKRKDREHFQVSPRLTGYRAVDVWLTVVEPGRDSDVELNDRNMWMTAIEERRTPDVGR